MSRIREKNNWPMLCELTYVCVTLMVFKKCSPLLGDGSFCTGTSARIRLDVGRCLSSKMGTALSQICLFGAQTLWYLLYCTVVYCGVLYFKTIWPFLRNLVVGCLFFGPFDVIDLEVVRFNHFTLTVHNFMEVTKFWYL